MKWIDKKSDKNKIKKLVIIQPYNSMNDGELHDKNGSWLKKEENHSFNLY